jgi:inosine-uridine nucleoside N-ribohydrolase
MSSSIHDKLNRVRKPRVHITYDVETEGALTGGMTVADFRPYSEAERNVNVSAPSRAVAAPNSTLVYRPVCAAIDSRRAR